MESRLSDEVKANTRYLFKAFKAIYSHKFVSMYPNSEDQLVAMRLWAVKIAPYTRQEIDQALLSATDTHAWVPSIAEFLAILKVHRTNNKLRQPLDHTPRIKCDKKKIKFNIDMIRKAFPFL